MHAHCDLGALQTIADGPCMFWLQFVSLCARTCFILTLRMHKCVERVQGLHTLASTFDPHETYAHRALPSSQCRAHWWRELHHYGVKHSHIHICSRQLAQAKHLSHGLPSLGLLTRSHCSTLVSNVRDPDLPNKKSCKGMLREAYHCWSPKSIPLPFVSRASSCMRFSRSKHTFRAAASSGDSVA